MVWLDYIKYSVCSLHVLPRICTGFSRSTPQSKDMYFNSIWGSKKLASSENGYGCLFYVSPVMDWPDSSPPLKEKCYRLWIRMCKKVEITKEKKEKAGCSVHTAALTSNRGSTTLADQYCSLRGLRVIHLRL